METIEAKNRILKVAQGMLAGDIHLLVGCRIITGLYSYTDQPDDEIFLTFRSIDSDIDRFPIGVSRELCDPDYLIRIDQEISTYLQAAESDIRKACSKIIEEFTIKT